MLGWMVWQCHATWPGVTVSRHTRWHGSVTPVSLRHQNGLARLVLAHHATTAGAIGFSCLYCWRDRPRKNHFLGLSVQPVFVFFMFQNIKIVLSSWLGNMYIPKSWTMLFMFWTKVLITTIVYMKSTNAKINIVHITSKCAMFREFFRNIHPSNWILFMFLSKHQMSRPFPPSDAIFVKPFPNSTVS